MPFRGWAVILAEAVVIGFFVLLAYTGFEVLVVLEGEYLVSPYLDTHPIHSVRDTNWCDIICGLRSFKLP